MGDDSFYHLTCLLSRESRLKGVRMCSAGMSQLLWRHVASIHTEVRNANSSMSKKHNSVHHFTEVTLWAVDKLFTRDQTRTRRGCDSLLTNPPQMDWGQHTENIPQSNRDETQSYSESVCRHLIMMSVKLKENYHLQVGGVIYVWLIHNWLTRYSSGLWCQGFDQPIVKNSADALFGTMSPQRVESGHTGSARVVSSLLHISALAYRWYVFCDPFRSLPVVEVVRADSYLDSLLIRQASQSQNLIPYLSLALSPESKVTKTIGKWKKMQHKPVNLWVILLS